MATGKSIKKGEIMSLVKFEAISAPEMASVLTTESVEGMALYTTPTIILHIILASSSGKLRSDGGYPAGMKRAVAFSVVPATAQTIASGRCTTGQNSPKQGAFPHILPAILGASCPLLPSTNQ
jgi:hypothetical protein